MRSTDPLVAIQEYCAEKNSTWNSDFVHNDCVVYLSINDAVI